MSLLAHFAEGQAGLIDSAQARSQAVQLARAGEYQKSLELLRPFASEGYQNEGYWQDYITILCWAGRERTAIGLAEERYQGKYEALPTYVLKALEGAYQNQRESEKSAALLGVLLGRGELENRVRYAEQLMEIGRLLEADQAYDQAMTENVAPAYRINYSRSIANLKRGDFIAADAYLERARGDLMKHPDGDMIVRDLEARSAALLIRAGETGAAARLLEKYIDAGTATPHMTADYLIALRYSRAGALEAFERLCPVWEDVPLYGLQHMGDAYFRERRYKKAERVYAYILQKDNAAPFVRAGRAYCLAMLGREDAAFDAYEIVAAQYPAAHSALAADGRSYVADGRIHLARKVFSLLGTTPEEKAAYRYQYADALAAAGYYHESQRIYRDLGENKADAGRALAGMAINKARRGLNADAKEILSEAEARHASEKEYALARIAYSERYAGGLWGEFSHSADYKGNDTYFYGISREQDIGGNFFLINRAYRETLRDHQARQVLTHVDNGLSYRYDRGRTDLIYRNTSGDYRDGALAFYTEYEPSDLATLAFRAGKRPHGAAGAVAQEVDEQYRSLRWEQKIDRKSTIALEYEWDQLSDGNRMRAYSGEFAYNTWNTAVKVDHLLLNYGWSGYENESAYYESPRKRRSIGAGLSQKWLLPNKARSWEWIVMGSWGHDDEEPTDFSPYTRLVFTQDLRANQSFTLGTEYGWRTKRLEDSGALYHGYYQIDFYYNWIW